MSKDAEDARPAGARKSPSDAGKDGTSRESRLAAALRANLRRRKATQRKDDDKV